MKIIACFLITFYATHIYTQNIFWGYPDNRIALKKGDRIVLEPFNWDFNGQLDTSAITYLNDLKAYIIAHPEFHYSIILNTDYRADDNSNYDLTVNQAKRINEFFILDASFMQNSKYSIIPKGETEVLFNKSCVDAQENKLYKELFHLLNNRVEILLE